MVNDGKANYYRVSEQASEQPAEKNIRLGARLEEATHSNGDYDHPVYEPMILFI
jgi:hypothetical protein